MAIAAPTERKVVGQSSVKTGAGSTVGGKNIPGAATEVEEPVKKSKKKLFIIIAVVVLALGGAGYFFLMPKSNAVAVPKAGNIVTMDAMTLNLAGGHYLKVQVALTLVAGHEAGMETTKAANIIIDEFSNLTVPQISSKAKREALKKDLVKNLQGAYPGQIFDTDFIQFVSE
ncbi:flagellar FliL protein [Jatrophihabitans sp. GAS493]|uniref:flagellar basal body-associated FliL family protein n=1 Tax=Jatrophihabitans sp. GAS493 TaxID=1907575 RepID=UPI000BB96232|nr:flagellar basal body-associated FliL family protein [Jatrophihabitans sp. GAS493]SOD71325.1 flagellar FliL protein [Jatrophihabitans sp. GAS493]